MSFEAVTAHDVSVEVRLFGGFDLCLGGVPVTIQRGAQRVLALLAVRRRPLARDAVSATLWPDLDVAKRSARLRQALWRIRSDTSLELIERSGDTLSLSSRVRVDVDRLRCTTEVVPSESSIDDFIATADRCSGGLLAEWDETWLDPARSEVRRLLESACQEHVDILRTSAPDSARRVAESWVDWQPDNEGAYRALLEILDAVGLNSEAIAVHDRLVAVLRDSLDVGVSDDLAARQELRRETSRGRRPATPARETSPHAFGNERTMLLDRAMFVEAGFPAIAIAIGEAGSGKTALCRKLVSDLEWRGWSTVSLTFDDDTHAIETAIESAALRPLAILLDDAHVASAAVAEALSELAVGLSDRPILIVATTLALDDASNHGRTLLHTLDSRPTATRIEIEPLNLRRTHDIVCHFDERLGITESQRILEHSGGNPQVIRLVLRSLSVTKDGVELRATDIADEDPITRVITGLDPTPRRVLSAIALAQTRLPLGALRSAFPDTETVNMLDALTHLCHLGLLVHDRGHYRIVHGRVRVAVEATLGSDEQAELVDTLLAAIARRMQPLRNALLAEMRGESEQAFGAFARAGHAAKTEGDHAAAVDHYSAALRHLHAADSTERPILLLALHDAASVVGDLERCRSSLQHLTRHATAEFQHMISLRQGWFELKTAEIPSAIERSSLLMSVALDSAEWPPDGGAFRLHALAAHEAGNGLDARDRLQQLLQVETEPAAIAEIHLSLALIARLHSEKGLGLRHLEQAADRYRIAGNDHGWIDATRMLGMVNVHSGQRNAGLQLLSMASLRARRLQDHRRWVLCETSIAMAHATLLDEPGFALTILRSLLPHVRRYQSDASVAGLLNLIAVIESFSLGRNGPAAERVQEAVQLAADGAHDWYLGLTLWTASEIAQADGDPDSSISLLHDALEALERCGEIPPTEAVHADLAALEAQVGNFDSAMLHLRKAYSLQELHDHTEYQSAILRRHGHVLSERRLHAEAANKHLASVAALCPGVTHRYLYFDDAAEALLAAGQHLQSRCYRLRAWDDFERYVATFEATLRIEVMTSNSEFVSKAEHTRAAWELVQLPLLEDARHVVDVAWERVPGGISDDQNRRRDVLRRLCDQSIAQGASATRAELARATGVSERTITRDLAIIAERPIVA